MITRISASIALAACAVAFAACGGKVTTTTSNTANNAPANTNTNSSAAANTNSSAGNSGGSANAPITVTGKWEMVGKEGDWKGTVDMVGMDGFLWSVESDGSLYKTDPATGNFTQVGDKGSFSKLKHLEAMDHLLWTVEGDSLYKSDPSTGKWELSGQGGQIVSAGLPRDLDGLIDPNDAFASLGFTIDIPRRELSVFDPREVPLSARNQPRDGAVVSWLQQGNSHRPFVMLDTGERALIDTGSSLGFGVRDPNAPAASSRASAVHDVGGSVSTHRVAPRTVSIGSLVLRNVPTDIISGASSDTPVLLGLNALRPFRLRFDPLHHLIEISPDND